MKTLTLDAYIQQLKVLFSDEQIRFSKDEEGDELYTAVFFNIEKEREQEIEERIFDIYYHKRWGIVPYMTVIGYTPEETSLLFPEYAKRIGWSSYLEFVHTPSYNVPVVYPEDILQVA